MSLCIAAGAAALTLATQSFTLAWTHSVEKTEWREHWEVTAEGLDLTEARIKGSGAGMEPPADAVLKDGWYVYRPDVPPLAALRLAVSGATGEGWRLCADGDCTVLDDLLAGAAAGAAGGAAASAAADAARSGPYGEIVLSACARP